MKDIFENKIYKSDVCNNYIENIVNEVNNILIEWNNRPFSYHVCFNIFFYCLWGVLRTKIWINKIEKSPLLKDLRSNKLPMKDIYFNFIFYNIEYMPFYFNYSNDSLFCILLVFIVNNWTFVSNIIFNFLFFMPFFG